MKKYLLAVIISTGFCVAAEAQSKFSLGPTAGIGGTWVTKMENSGTKVGAAAGLSLVYSAAEHFGIGVDAKYSWEGGKSDFNGTKTNLNLNYVRIPLKAIYFFNSYGDKLRPKVAIGPSFGFLASANQKVEIGNSISSDVDVKDRLDNFDLGVLGSVGINYRLVKDTWFNADVTYTHGVTEIMDNSGMRNKNLGVNIGVNFGL